MIHCLTVEAQVVDWLSYPDSNYNPSDRQRPSCIATDNNGITYMAGNYWHSLKWGSANLTNTGNHTFLLSFAPDGSVRWGRTFTPTSFIDVADLVVDSKDYLYLFGSFTGNLSLNGVPSNNTFGSDGLIAKMDSAGNYVWVEYIEVPQGNAYPTSIAVDENDNVYVAGSFYDTIMFDTISLVSQSSQHDGFVAKYDSTGACLWANSVFATGTSQATAAITSVGAQAGYVYLGGAWHGQGNFGAVSEPSFSQTPAHHAAFASQLISSDGSFRWSKFAKDTGHYESFIVGADPHGNLVAAHSGWYFPNNVFHYDSTGALNWSTSYTFAGERMLDVVLDSAGEIYIVGDRDKPLMGTEGFYYSFRSNGGPGSGAVCKSSHPYGFVECTGVSVNTLADVHVCGYFSGGDFGYIGMSPQVNKVPIRGTEEPFIFKMKNWLTGIAEHDASNSLSVFPNPASDVVAISGIPAYESHNVKLFDQAGRLVQDITSKGGEIQVSELPMGMYTITLVKNGVPTVGKVVVQH